MRVEVIASDFTDLQSVAILSGDHADATLVRMQLGTKHGDTLGGECLRMT